ncbi:hypothetical protein [Salipaludibacillus daqingensis]|uniref:hypothetical protein n=1 Tax=Salipaludibacillus daqingensis TaxID=3041001 RepID=UPI0024748FEB|nr:hypothetical protein [Salipaludibacillus daqingensis]
MKLEGRKERYVMRHWLDHYIYILYSTVLISYVINVFIGIEAVNYIIGLIAIPMLLVSFLGASNLFRLLGSLFLMTGLFLFIQSGLPLQEAFLFFTDNLRLLALLAVLPWMNSVVRAGRFDRRMNQLMKANVSDLGKLYVRSSITTYTLISFINLSALTLTQGVLLQNLSNLSKKLKDTFISQTTLRAFSMALVWSPMEIIVAISVDATGVGYVTILPWLLLISLITMVIDNIWGRYYYGKLPYHAPSNAVGRSFSVKTIIFQISQLFGALVTFLFIIVFTSSLLDLNFILTVTLVILPFSFIWSIVMKRVRSFITIGWNTWKVRTNGMQNFVVLFVSLGFFSNSLNATPALEAIQHPFMAMAEYPLVILFFIQMTYLLLSMIGIHPVATIGVLMEVVTPLYQDINPLSIGIVLITGALATATVGTYGVTVTMTSMNTQQNPYRITLKNMPFALIYGGIGTFVAFFLL